MKKKIGEILVSVIRTLLNSGHTAAALTILMTYQHYVPADELDELKTLTLEELHKRILEESSYLIKELKKKD
ncbi:MAG: hypothetical protein PWP49_1096 [Thermococcaceae archaeon]|nr:hypothetical protein [Thermococcaceae archaeon]